MKGMHHEECIDQTEEVSLLDGEYDRNCNVCGRRFITTRRQAYMCPECRRRKRHEAGATGGKNAHETWKRKHGAGGAPHDVSADDVPDVPSDEALYYSESDKIKKTAPIEAHLGPYKPEEGEIEMDLSKFPSSSNRLEHPEAFLGDVVTPTTTGVDIPNTAIGYVPNPTPVCDTKRRLMDLYGQITSISAETGLAVLDIIDRMTRIDAALN